MDACIIKNLYWFRPRDLLIDLMGDPSERHPARIFPYIPAGTDRDKLVVRKYYDEDWIVDYI